MDGTDALPEDAVEAIDSRESRHHKARRQSDKRNGNDNRNEIGDEDEDKDEPYQARRASVNEAGYPNLFEEDSVLPSRWWLAASAFPMAAGTLGPVASAFSICALVRPWRQEIKPGEDIDTATFIKDPVWLTTVNAVQLVIALVANMLLLLQMARRVRFVVAQPITMAGWYFSSLTLIALTATAAGPLQRTTELSVGSVLVWSQAFYYAIYAAILYMLVASLMVVTFTGACKGHYPKEFQLSNSQRTLMLQTIMFLMYLLLGALVFSNLEGWAYLDAVYWADVTLFTVGFGDLAAATTAGRALLFPYALIGIISLGLVIGSIRSLALERGRRRLNARMTEKNRRRFLRSLTKTGRDAILQPIQPGAYGHSRGSDNGSDRGSGSLRRSIRTSFTRSRPHTATGLTEYERREQEFNIMRKIQHDAATKRRWLAMATSGGIWILLWLLGAWVFQASEHPYQGWNYFDGFYMSFVSLTTIGYGDVTPVSNAGRSFFVFWSLLALPAMTILISHAGDTIVKTVSDVTNAIGRITILPGERGLKRDLKATVRALTCGAVFDDVDIEEAPPGLLGAAQQTEGEREDEIDDDEDDDEQEAEDAVDEVEGGAGDGAEKGDDNDGNTVTDAYSTRNEYMSEDGLFIGPSTRTDSNTTIAEGSAASTSNRAAAPGGTTRSASRPTSRHARPRSSSARTEQPTSKQPTSAAPPNQNTRARQGYALGAVPAVSVARTEFPPDLPHTRAEYHCVLLDEIARVTEHLRHATPRKYSFQEWAWFLRLIGEDEHNADHHRKVTLAPTPAKERRLLALKGSPAEADADADADTADTDTTATLDTHTGAAGQWSWVGTRSPLMGSQEEGEWILDKLTKRLQAELAAAKDAAMDDDANHASSRSTSAGDGADPRPYSSGNRHATHPIEEEP